MSKKYARSYSVILSRILGLSGTLFSLLCLSALYSNDFATIAQPKHAQYGLGIAQEFYTGGIPHVLPNYCLTVIAPSDGGRTAQSPALYLYLLKRKEESSDLPSNIPFELVFRLRESKENDSQLVYQGKGKISEVGFYKIMLPDSNPSILNGRIQRWVMYFSNQWTNLNNSSSYIQQEPNINLEREIRREKTLLAKARIYAKYYYWYDAFDAYSQWLDANPRDLIARRDRLKMLQENFASGCTDDSYTSTNKLLELIDAQPAKAIEFQQRK